MPSRLLRTVAALVTLAPLAAGAQTATTTPAPPRKPEILATPNSLSFGNVIYGGTPATQGFAITNVGDSDLSLLGITVKGNTDFAVVQACGVTVKAHAKCNVSVSFAPHAIGARAGTVEIKSNAVNDPVEIKVTGTGCRYFSPAAARFFLTSC